MAGVFVLDTSAIMAAFKAEPGHEQVRDILKAADGDATISIYVPFMALMEVEYQFLRVMSEADADYWTDVALSWPVALVESTAEWRKAAASVKTRGGLSLADAWIAALALLNDAELVHKDPEFDAVSGLRALRLPYDRANRSSR